MSSQRPGFPVRLTPTAAAAMRGRGTQIPLQSALSTVSLMASNALRARMVQRLAAQGIADARVLAAMNAVERLELLARARRVDIAGDLRRFELLSVLVNECPGVRHLLRRGMNAMQPLQSLRIRLRQRS